MAPITRSKSYKTPPQSPSKVCEADIIKKTAFFHAYDTRQPGKSLAAIARECNTTSPSARRWLRQRTQIGSPVYRHTRKRATRLGRPPKLQESTFKMLVSPSQNPVRDQLYEAQIEYHKLDVHPCTIQRGLKSIQMVDNGISRHISKSRFPQKTSNNVYNMARSIKIR